MNDDVHRSFPPPAVGDRVDGDRDVGLDAGRAGPGPGQERAEGSRFAPPAADQRVELTRSYLPWVVLVTLLGLAVAVHFLL